MHKYQNIFIAKHIDSDRVYCYRIYVYITQGVHKMPKFSQESFSKLSTCHHDLQILFFEVIKYTDCTILQGYRSLADQEQDYAKGLSKLHKGKHNTQPSMAVDVAPYPIDFNDKLKAIWFGGYVLGIAEMLKSQGKMTHAVRWGGSWDGLGELDTAKQLQDQDHFELLE